MDYKNGVIYKICCKDKDITDCYVGSSCSHTSRKSAHKCAYNNKKSDKYNLPVYRYIRDNGGWDNWEFVLLEVYPCENKNQLAIRERYWFEKLGAKLNNRYPERTKKEWSKNHYEKNKEEFKEKQKIHYEKNKEEILEKIECECGSVVCRVNLTRHKKSQKHQDYLKSLEETDN